MISKYLRCCYWFILLPALFSGCNAPESKQSTVGITEGTTPGIGQIDDSLRKLDSLVNVYKVRDYPLAKTYAKRALVLTSGEADPALRARALGMMGLVFSFTDQDSSFLCYHQALELSIQEKAMTEVPGILYRLGALYSFAGSHQHAIALLDSCIKMAGRLDQPLVISDACNCLGNVYWEVHDLVRSRAMYEASLQLSLKRGLDLQTATALTNLSQFDTVAGQALARLRQALYYVRSIDGAEEETALIYNNMAYHLSNPDSVLFYSMKAIGVAETSLLPEVEMGAYNNMAYCYMDKGNLAMAEGCLKEKAIPLALRTGNVSWQASLYDSYADVMVAKGDLQSAIGYQKEAYRLRREAEIKNGASQVRLLSVILEVKEKEQIIGAREREIRQRNETLWLISGIAAILVLMIIVMALLYIRRVTQGKLTVQLLQNQSARKLIELEEQEKGRVAAEIHDIAGNILTGLAGYADEAEEVERPGYQQIRHHIQILSDRLRQLSHRIALVKSAETGLFNTLSDLAGDLGAISGKPVHLVFPSSEPEVSPEQRLHISRIAQELMMNGISHAKKGVIKLSFDLRNEFLFIFYEDGGPGFNADQAHGKGLGINSIFERSKILHGSAVLHSSDAEGTRWTISIPIKYR